VARDPGPGNAILFGTTPLFLEKLGLDSVADLPPIAQFVPDAGIVEQLEHGLRARPPEPDPDERTPDAEPEDEADPTSDEDDAHRTSDGDASGVDRSAAEDQASDAAEVGGASTEPPAADATPDEDAPGDHGQVDAGIERSGSGEPGGTADPAGPGPR
jgi:segregation and condensation protein B